jgi:hypothetical protein
VKEKRKRKGKKDTDERKMKKCIRVNRLEN